MILLDTHVLLWFLCQPEKLSAKAKRAIDSAREKNEVMVSAISVWEICMLIKKGRLKVTLDPERFINKIEELPFVQFIPVDNAIVVKSTLLDGAFHQDPADRIITATALVYGIGLVTSDARLLKYKKVKTVW